MPFEELTGGGGGWLGLGLADEIGLAGRIDEVDAFAVVVEMENAAIDGVLVFFFFVVEVADAGAAESTSEGDVVEGSVEGAS